MAIPMVTISCSNMPSYSFARKAIDEQMSSIKARIQNIKNKFSYNELITMNPRELEKEILKLINSSKFGLYEISLLNIFKNRTKKSIILCFQCKKNPLSGSIIKVMACEIEGLG